MEDILETLDKINNALDKITNDLGILSDYVLEKYKDYELECVGNNQYRDCNGVIYNGPYDCLMDIINSDNFENKLLLDKLPSDIKGILLLYKFLSSKSYSIYKKCSKELNVDPIFDYIFTWFCENDGFNKYIGE